MRVDEHTINLDDSPVFYRSADASGMSNLYLHGIPTSSDDWLEFLGRTGGIAPDLIGFGRSGKGGHLDYSLAGLAGFVERFLDHLGVEEVSAVGHDWGAAVALTFAARHPDRVPRVTLINAPPLVGGPAEWPRILRLWRARGIGELIMGATTKGLMARTLRRGVRPLDAWPDARIAAVWEQFDQGTQRAILRLVRSAGDDVIGGGPRPPLPAVATTAIVWGVEDPWYPPALADAYAARLPGATIERVAGAGHWPWLDRPEVVDRVASLLEG